MSIRIRLARHGVRNNPLYHIVAIKSTRAREGRPLEKLGEYDPIPKIPHTDAIPPANRIFGKERVPQPIAKRVEWDVSRLTWWLDNGAQPSTPVVKLMQKVGPSSLSRHRRCLSMTRPHLWKMDNLCFYSGMIWLTDDIGWFAGGKVLMGETTT